MRQHEQRGFTLFEILLAVVLLSLITLGSLMFYRGRLDTFRVDKTALKIQQWLQAGQNYYVDKSAWPISRTELAPYLPVNSDKNAWGMPIDIPSTQMANDPLFHVQTTLPELGDAAGRLSSRIAGQLPNAKADLAKHSVLSEVAAPGGSNENSKGQRIVSIQNVEMPIASDEELKKRIRMPTQAECPEGTHQSHIFYAIAEAHFNVSLRIPHLLKHIKGLPEHWQQDPKATLLPMLEARAVITHSDKQEMEDPENYRHVGPDHQYANKEGALLAIVTCEKIETSSLVPPPNSNFFF